jgi:hypothetical protein
VFEDGGRIEVHTVDALLVENLEAIENLPEVCLGVFFLSKVYIYLTMLCTLVYPFWRRSRRVPSLQYSVKM